MNSLSYDFYLLITKIQRPARQENVEAGLAKTWEMSSGIHLLIPINKVLLLFTPLPHTNL